MFVLQAVCPCPNRDNVNFVSNKKKMKRIFDSRYFEKKVPLKEKYS